MVGWQCDHNSLHLSTLDIQQITERFSFFPLTVIFNLMFLLKCVDALSDIPDKAYYVEIILPFSIKHLYNMQISLVCLCSHSLKGQKKTLNVHYKKCFLNIKACMDSPPTK